MKRYFFLFLLLIINTLSHAKIGRHNLQFNVGGGYQVIFKSETPRHFVDNDPSYLLGGGFITIELGYLFHSVRDNNVVHGFDLRIDFSMGFLNATVTETLMSKVTQQSTKMYGGFAMTYTLGRQFKSGRLMFDIIGLGLIFGSTDSSRFITYHDLMGLPDETNSWGIYKGLGIQYVGPGIQFIMNNGFTIGWRNKATLYFDAQAHEGRVGFNTALTLGFTFGGGK